MKRAKTKIDETASRPSEATVQRNADGGYEYHPDELRALDEFESRYSYVMSAKVRHRLISSSKTQALAPTPRKQSKTLRGRK